jgi:hypothetical protein
MYKFSGKAQREDEPRPCGIEKTSVEKRSETRLHVYEKKLGL